jgi:hypothetical protein
MNKVVIIDRFHSIMVFELYQFIVAKHSAQIVVLCFVCGLSLEGGNCLCGQINLMSVLELVTFKYPLT